MKDPFSTCMLIGVLLLINLGTRFLLTGGEAQDPNNPLYVPRRKGFAALPPLFWAIIAGTTAILTPIPESWEVARLADNRVLINTLLFRWNSIDGRGDGEVSPSDNFGPLIAGELNGESGNRRSVIVVMLEATGSRYSGLTERSIARMPNLAALAQRGAWSNHAYTPIPNTSKAVYGIQCGRMPLWQSEHLELSDENRVECLASALSEADYATAYFQSALGAFEDRPRLAAKLGFEHFEAWENIKGEPAGRLASNDLSLARALEGWLADLPAGKPFFATLVTSQPQDPYAFSPKQARKLMRRGYELRNFSAQQRFALLVQESDALVERITQLLEKRGLTKNTIIAVVGNHGEGFGDHDIKLHDNNYYEESIRVPLVIAGPGVKAGEIEGEVSVLDLAPSLAELLGLEVAFEASSSRGRSVFAADRTERDFIFSCLFEERCYGSIRGTQKLVVLPKRDIVLEFDLERDPTETQPIPVLGQNERLRESRSLESSYRLKLETPTLAAVEFESGWRCEQNAPCKHPDSPENGIFIP